MSLSRWDLSKIYCFLVLVCGLFHCNTRVFPHETKTVIKLNVLDYWQKVFPAFQHLYEKII